MKPSKNQLRRAKKKAQKAEVRPHPSRIYYTERSKANTTAKAATLPVQDETPMEPSAPLPTPRDTTTDDIDLVPEPSDPLWEMYKDVAGKFDEVAAESSTLKDSEKPEVYFDDGDEIPDEEHENEPKL